MSRPSAVSAVKKTSPTPSAPAPSQPPVSTAAVPNPSLEPLLRRQKPLLTQAAPPPATLGEQIKQACLAVGFVFGNAKAGNGFAADCTVPIMQGTPQPASAILPLPHLDPELAAACKIKNAKFGVPVHAGGAKAGSADPADSTPTP